MSQQLIRISNTVSMQLKAVHTTGNNYHTTDRTNVPRRPCLYLREASCYFVQEHHKPTESIQDATEMPHISGPPPLVPQRLSSFTQQVLPLICHFSNPFLFLQLVSFRAEFLEANNGFRRRHKVPPIRLSPRVNCLVLSFARAHL